MLRTSYAISSLLSRGLSRPLPGFLGNYVVPRSAGTKTSPSMTDGWRPSQQPKCSKFRTGAHVFLVFDPVPGVRFPSASVLFQIADRREHHLLKTCEMAPLSLREFYISSNNRKQVCCPRADNMDSRAPCESTSRSRLVSRVAESEHSSSRRRSDFSACPAQDACQMGLQPYARGGWRGSLAQLSAPDGPRLARLGLEHARRRWARSMSPRPGSQFRSLRLLGNVDEQDVLTRCYSRS